MKIEYVDNACCVYESEGFRLIADPWLTDGAFEGSWYHLMGKIPADTTYLINSDALYISHLHPDHYDPETLSRFRTNIPVLVLDRPPNFLHKKLQDLGFTNLIKVKDGETVQVGPFEATLYAPFVKHPFDESVLGNFIDSALVLRDRDDLVLNANDNTPTEETAATLFAKHGPFTMAQLKFALAGPYPSCFSNLTAIEKLAEKERLLARLRQKMKRVSDILQVKETVSFAGSYCLAGSLAFKNEWLAVDGLDLSKVPKGYLYYHELDPRPEGGELYVLCAKARQSLWLKQERYNYFPDYEIAISIEPGKYFQFNLKNNRCHLSGGLSANLSCQMDYALLKRICLKKSHWNSAEIGCHIDFYRIPNIYKPDVHTIMSFFHI